MREVGGEEGVVVGDVFEPDFTIDVQIEDGVDGLLKEDV